MGVAAIDGIEFGAPIFLMFLFLTGFYFILLFCSKTCLTLGPGANIHLTMLMVFSLLFVNLSVFCSFRFLEMLKEKKKKLHLILLLFAQVERVQEKRGNDSVIPVDSSAVKGRNATTALRPYLICSCTLVLECGDGGRRALHSLCRPPSSLTRVPSRSFCFGAHRTILAIQTTTT